MFERRFVAGWADMDFNSHMRNTAFLDKSADVRMMFFSENGFSMDEFIRRKIGPVIRKDELEYFKEIRLLDVRAREHHTPYLRIAPIAPHAWCE
jgi:acyl-CoA thioester hydrolase